MRRFAPTGLLAVMAFVPAVAAAEAAQKNVRARQSDCPVSSAARDEVERTVQAFFDALRNDDDGAFQRLTTASFSSFDGGKRFAGIELVDVVRNAHSGGVQLNWSVGRLVTKIRCDVAWSAWENVGSAGIPPDVRPVRWLESAVLVRRDGNWKIDLFSSQRAAEK